MTEPTKAFIDERYFRIADIIEIVQEGSALDYSEDCWQHIAAGSALVDRLRQSNAHVYGVNTGFGSLAEVKVAADEVHNLQLNHVLSHAAGIGDPISPEVSQLVVLIKLLTFRTGRTGISPQVARKLMEIYNAGIVPAIPRKGTVGASGDLAPLAHMALPILGVGRVYYKDELVDAATALADTGISPVHLGPKDGLALTNGVQYISAISAHVVGRAHRLIDIADFISAMSTQAFGCASTFYDHRYHATSHHRERAWTAANLASATAGSNHWMLPTSNQSKQDPYSFRCIPQVHGAVRQLTQFVHDVIEREVNGVSDNPLFFAEDDEVLFGGNLHGESVALALDCQAMALTELASISERRTYQLLSGQRGLPDFLVDSPGVNSGFMVAQYTAAALVNEMKVLSSPASVDSIPTCQLQEDHVSMGGTAALKLLTIVDDCEYVLGIELMLAAQAIELNTALVPSSLVSRLLPHYRRTVEHLHGDRLLAPDLEASRDFLRHALWDFLAAQQFGSSQDPKRNE